VGIVCVTSVNLAERYKIVFTVMIVSPKIVMNVATRRAVMGKVICMECIFVSIVGRIGFIHQKIDFGVL